MPEKIGKLLGDLALLASVVVMLIIADAPTWFWLGIAAVFWLEMKTQDWVRASK